MNEWNVQLIKLRYDRYFIHYYNKLHILNFVTNNFACVEPISATVHGHAVISCGCWVLFVVSNCNRIPQEWKMHHSSGMNVFKIGRCDKLNKKNKRLLYLLFKYLFSRIFGKFICFTHVLHQLIVFVIFIEYIFLFKNECRTTMIFQTTTERKTSYL